MAALAVIGVGAFFLTRDDDDGESLASLPTDETVPDVTVPDVTVPDVTIPDVTIPDITIPDFTLPDITDFSIPDITLPDLGEIPPPGQEPVGLGNDPELDRLARVLRRRHGVMRRPVWTVGASAPTMRHTATRAPGARRPIRICSASSPSRADEP